MTEEEKFEETLASIKEIFFSLTEKEPTPDEEIDAREQLITLFNGLTGYLSFPEYKDLIEVIKDKLEKWDTLDFWFTETTIPDDIKVFLNFPDLTDVDQTSKLTEIKDNQIRDTQIKESGELSQTPSNLDVNDIVSEVSQRFKGEIDSLKDTINGLKKELDKKSETLEKISQKKKVQKITPKKTSKLAPPVIKIPVIKKFKFPSESQIDASIPPILPKEEQKVSAMEEVKIPPKKAEVKNFTPIPEKPEGMIVRNNKDLTPIPIKKVKKKKPEITTTVIEESKDVPTITEKRKLIPIVSEIYSEPVEVVEKEDRKIQPFSVNPPKIRSMGVEEVETDLIKSSGSDLFNVLSQVGESQQVVPKKEKETSKITETFLKEVKPIEVEEIKDFEQSIQQQPQINSFVDFGKGNTEGLPVHRGSSEDLPVPHSGDLPVDKDALYQELIALEGKRYAVEKGYKELEASYNKGSIADTQYKQKNEEIKTKMLQITDRITTIRRLISSL
ncbi:MAG: hypothetical protein ACTSPN_14065 [Promethearchaeota archaeon]